MRRASDRRKSENEKETVYSLGEDKSRKSSIVSAVACQNSRCHQEIVCSDSSNYYCSRECFNLRRAKEEFKQDRGVYFRHANIIGIGGTGLLMDKDSLDNIFVRVDDQFGRIVTISSSTPERSIWNRKQKNTKAKAKEKTKQKAARTEEKRKLKQLLNIRVAGSDSSSSEEDDDTEDDDDADVEEAGEEIQSIFCRGVNSSICPMHPPLTSRAGNSVYQGYVINVVNPWEIYIQSSSMIQKLYEIDSICNRDVGLDPRHVSKNWKPEIGGYCCAKYEKNLYRAKILEHLGDFFRVKFVDYGNVDLVKIQDVHQLHPELTLIPRQCIYFRLSNAKPIKGRERWNRKVKEFTIECLDGATVELKIEIVERGIIHIGHLNVLSSVSNKVRGDLGEALVKIQLAEQDSYYLS